MSLPLVCFVKVNHACLTFFELYMYILIVTSVLVCNYCIQYTHLIIILKILNKLHLIYSAKISEEAIIIIIMLVGVEQRLVSMLGICSELKIKTGTIIP